MSAETIPADVVKLARRVVLHCQNTPPEEATKIVERVIASAFTRPAEPAAPVAEAGEGEVSRYIAKCREMSKGENGHTYTWWSRLADLLSTIETERARADAAEQRAADALARAEKAEGAQGALVDLADWLENDCGAELPHSHIEKQVAIARGAPPRAERAERGLNVDATMALIEGALKWAVWCVGEGIMAIESEGVAAPEDFLMTYSDATGEEDWETLHERLPALLRASREAQPATDGGDNG